MDYSFIHSSFIAVTTAIIKIRIIVATPAFGDLITFTYIRIVKLMLFMMLGFIAS